jgi:carbonic anhydrase/acetyltransferase-like protein (isoleucine patch superfamily)
MRPKVHPTAFVAPTAAVIGDVVLAENSSVWFGAILRGDSGQIVIGEGSNIQDGAVLHDGTKVGKNCTISHMASVHGCTIDDNVLIANGALVLDGCEIGEGAVIGAGAVLPPGTKVPPGTLMFGVPASPAGEVKERHREATLRAARVYVGRRQQYLDDLGAGEPWASQDPRRQNPTQM